MDTALRIRRYGVTFPLLPSSIPYSKKFPELQASYEDFSRFFLALRRHIFEVPPSPSDEVPSYLDEALSFLLIFSSLFNSTYLSFSYFFHLFPFS